MILSIKRGNHFKGLQQQFQLGAWALVLATGLAACGGSSRSSGPNPTPGPTTTTWVTPTPLPTDPGTTENLDRPYTFNYQLAGPSSNQEFAVDTNSILKIRVRAGDGIVSITSPGYTSYKLSYGCARYTVTVNGQSIQTKVLKVHGSYSALCADAPETQVMDFSSSIAGQSGKVTIKVSDPEYDYKCYYDRNQCPTTDLMTMHSIGGSLDVQVNGTTL